MDDLPDIAVPDYVAFDLETTGLSSDDDEILEIALVRFKGGLLADTWSTLVRPNRPVPLKTLRLTNISEDELERKLPFSADLAEKIDAFRGSLPLVGHNSDFDTAFLQKVMPDFPGVDVYDTLELSRIVFAGFDSYRLSELAGRLGVQVTEAHRAYDDAEVSGTIFRLIQEEALTMGGEARRRILQLMGRKWLPRPMFEFSDKRAQQPLFDTAGKRGELPGEEPARLDPAFSHKLRDEVMELIRSPSKDRVLSVPNTKDAACAAVQAALGFHRETGQSVLLLGFPEEARPAAITAAYPTGDYLCLHRFDEAMRLADKGALAGLDVEGRRYLSSIASWAERTEDGLLAQVQVMGNRDLMMEIACPEDLSCRDKCPRASRCFALKDCDGKRLSWARIDSLSRDSRWDRVLVWEFHRVAREFQRYDVVVNLHVVGAAFQELGLSALVPSLEDIPPGADIAEVIPLIPRMADELSRASRQARSKILEDYGRPESPVLERPPILSRGMRDVEHAARTMSEMRCQPAGTRLVMDTVFGAGGIKQQVLAQRALWPGELGLSRIRETATETILMSSLSDTICSRQGLRRSFGFAGTVHDEPPNAGSKGQKEVLLLQVDPSPVPSTAQYGRYLKDLLVNISQVYKSGVHVAFPSRALIKEVYGLASSELEERGIVLYAQGIDGGYRVLEHLGEEGTVVFSTMATLGSAYPVPSCLVVARIPFLPPNTLDDYRRREMSDIGLDPFVEVNLAQAVLTVRSHVQRQIDHGGKSAFVLADPRTCPGKSRWGKEFLASFSDLPRVSCPPRHVSTRLSGWNSGKG